MPRASFNPLDVWDALTSQAQRIIGATFLANEIAIQGSNSGGPGRTADIAFFENCERAVCGELQDLVAHNFRTAFNDDGDPLRPDLNAIGIRQCTECGCTDEHGCPEGCSWAGETICSVCAQAGSKA